MILVDTSIWIDHLDRTDAQLQTLLMAGRVLMHPFVVGELALGNLGNRDMLLEDLRNLPAALLATEREMPGFIVQHKLHGLGIGYIDVHLLAAVKLTPDAKLWTRYRRLQTAAAKLGLTANLAHQPRSFLICDKCEATPSSRRLRLSGSHAVQPAEVLTRFIERLRPIAAYGR